jgi:CDGSH-type Zn-finger protein
MEKPVIAAGTPIPLELEPGIYYWCRCGRSKNQPFCDSTHKNGTNFTPLEFAVIQKEKKHYCRCKHTANQPYCDGTHKTLPQK